MAYDKAAAHEYYEKYVKKGLKKGRKKKTAEEKAASERKSTKGLNDSGKAAAKQIKEQLQKERKAEYDKLKKDMQAKIDALKEKIKQAKAASKSKSDDLLDNMNGGGEDVEALKAEIEKLRTDTKAAKEKIKADYDERYLQMLDELKADKDFKGSSKKSSKKSK